MKLIKENIRFNAKNRVNLNNRLLIYTEMYFEYSFPDISIKFSEVLEKEKKRGLKLLKKAEKNNDFKEILNSRIHLSKVSVRMNDLSEAEKHLTEGLSPESRNALQEDYAKYYVSLAIVQALSNNREDALKNLNDAIKILDKSEDYKLQSIVRENLGIISVYEDDYDEAENLFIKSLDYAEKSKDSSFIARRKYTLGFVYFEKNEFEKSAEIFSQSLEIFEKNESVLEILKTKRILSKVYLKLNNLSLASKYINEVVDRTKNEKGNEFRHELALGYLGVTEIYLSENKYLRAEQIVEDAKKILSSIPDLRELAESYILHAKILIFRNRVHEAEKLILEAIRIYERSEQLFEEVELYEQIGFSMYENLEREKGNKYMEKTENAYKQSKNKTAYPRYLVRKGKLHFRMNELDKALSICDEAQSLFQEIEDKNGEAKVLRLKAQIFVSQSDYEKTEQALESALKNFKEIGMNKDTGLILRELADLNFIRDKTKESVKLLLESTPYFEKLALEREQLVNQSKLVRYYRKLGETGKVENILTSIALIADKIDFSSLEGVVADSFLFFGNELVEKGEFVKARTFLEKSKSAYRITKNNNGVANNNIRVAMSYFQEDNMVEAIGFIKLILSQIEQLDVTLDYAEMLKAAVEHMSSKDRNLKDIADCQLQTANIFLRFEKIKEAIEQYFFAMNKYFQANQFLNTVEMGDKVLELIDKVPDLNIKTQTQFLIGAAILEYDIPDMDKIFLMFNIAISGFDELENILMLGKTYTLLGDAHLKNMEFENARINFHFAINNLQKTTHYFDYLAVYDRLVDMHFAVGQLRQTSIYLDQQIDLVSQMPIKTKGDSIALYNYKQLAVNIALNNFGNAIGLIDKQLEKEEMYDDATKIRLKCEKICLYFLEGELSTCIDIYEELERKYGKELLHFNPHNFYEKHDSMYKNQLILIGRFTAVFHFLGDAYYKKENYYSSWKSYEKAGNFLKNEWPSLTSTKGKWVYKQDQKERERAFINELQEQGFVHLLAEKEKLAKYSYQAKGDSRRGVTGKVEHNCVRCLGKGTNTVIVDQGTYNNNCKLCGGKGTFRIKPPFLL